MKHTRRQTVALVLALLGTNATVAVAAADDIHSMDGLRDQRAAADELRLSDESTLAQTLTRIQKRKRNTDATLAEMNTSAPQLLKLTPPSVATALAAVTTSDGAIHLTQELLRSYHDRQIALNVAIDEPFLDSKLNALHAVTAGAEQAVDAASAQVTESRPTLDRFNSQGLAAMRSLQPALVDLAVQVDAAKIRQDKRLHAEKVCVAHPQTGSITRLEPVYFPGAALSSIIKEKIDEKLVPICATFSFTNARHADPNKGETFKKEVAEGLIRSDFDAEAIRTAWAPEADGLAKANLGSACNHYFRTHSFTMTLRGDEHLHGTFTIICEHENPIKNIDLSIDVYSDFYLQASADGKSYALKVHTTADDHISEDQRKALNAIGNIASLIPLTGSFGLKINLEIAAGLDAEQKGLKPIDGDVAKGNVPSVDKKDIPPSVTDQQTREDLLSFVNSWALEKVYFEQLQTGHVGVAVLMHNRLAPPKNLGVAEVIRNSFARLPGAIQAKRR